MNREITKRVLSAPRQRLVELMQEINFGRIEGLQVLSGEPVLTPPPRRLRDVRLGAKENGPHSMRVVGDFTLRREVVEMFALFDRERSVAIEVLEIQHGLPFRMTIADTARA